MSRTENANARRGAGRFSHLVGGVRDEDVEPAELLRGDLHRFLAERFVAEVARDEDAGLADELDLAFRLLRVRLLPRQVRDGDVRAFARVEDRHGPPDAAVAARDQGFLIEEFPGRSVERRRGPRRILHPLLQAGLAALFRFLERRLRFASNLRA